MGKVFAILKNACDSGEFFLLKNLSSATAGGRELSVGMQYLRQAKSFSNIKMESKLTKWHVADLSAQLQLISSQ